MTSVSPPAAGRDVIWAKVVDHSRCIGCHACSTACKSENEVPLGVHRTYVKHVDAGRFPEARRAFQVTRCNQCEVPPCAIACPTAAMFQRPDGIVDFDKEVCIGCKACIAACPYDAIFINPADNAAEKCNFCAHRLDVGLEPACAVVCPTEAILVGNLADNGTKVSRIVNREVVSVRRPEKETRPKLFYKNAHQATLDPLAAKRPEGGLFLWSEQGNDGVTAGHPAVPNSAAAAIVSYDVSHNQPWGWKVSLYTWTKGVAAGVYLVPASLIALGLAVDSQLWRWGPCLLGGAFLALTGGLLIWDLKRPERFLLIFKRPQWKSWLVRGACTILAYSIVLLLHFFGAVFGVFSLLAALVWVGIPLAVLTAVYTAFLFAQAKARDLWQSPLLPPHLVVQAVLLGSAVLVPMTGAGAGASGGLNPLQVDTAGLLGFLLRASCALHLLLVLGEATMTHATAHARLALREMTRGRYWRFFWCSVLLVGLGVFLPAGWVFALAGILLYEHAHVQAAQAVPIA